MHGFVGGKVSLLFLPHGSTVHEGVRGAGPGLWPKRLMFIGRKLSPCLFSFLFSFFSSP